jgi:hypothetical protein
MTPAERSKACIKLLAEIDQLIAEREDLADQPVLADDEREYLAVLLQFRRDARERVEKMLKPAARLAIATLDVSNVVEGRWMLSWGE